MTFKDIEKCFNRALLLSFNKKKIFLVFPILILSAILVVFCRALAFNASGWIIMSLIFLPIFLITGLFLAAGVFLNRIYYHEMKNIKLHYTDVFKKSFDVIIGTSYLSVPPILTYLLLWVIFGIFVLLKEIPGIGQFIAVVLSFAPFLIIFASILLCILNLALLFFISPAIALKDKGKFTLAKDVFENLKKNILSSILFFIVGIFPILFVLGILILSAVITDIGYSFYPHSLSVILEWFFISLPFALFLTPVVIFFFNFSLETYNLFQKKV
ncbi:MAG: hypothetical protein JXA94_03085 [Parachlamydiales bacterium]|nr:hypothetical protein [Parachlamydiales bacterium]